MHLSTVSINLKHFSPAELTGQPEELKNQVLGVIVFSPTGETPIGIPVLQALMPGGDDVCEAWFGSAPQTQGTKNTIRYCHDGHHLFGVIELPETEHVVGMAPLQRITETAYRQIFTLLDELQYPFAYRFWNYMRDINGISHGLERYRQFNLGRQEAYLACGREVKYALPAACALGLTQGPLKIAFLAGRKPALAIENPRQTSAYEYPLEYGPCSPTFARACLLPDEGMLLISGTASIVGYRTVHTGDVVAQTRETLANLQAVIEEANRRLGHPGFNLKTVCYRVYMRRAEDKPLIKNAMEYILGPAMRAMFVQADICRQDLLLEIEATATLSPELTEQP